MRLNQWYCLNIFLLGLTKAANSESQQLSAAQVVAQSRKVLRTTSASEDEPLRYLVVESEEVASAAAHGSGQNALVQAIEAALGKGGVARRLSDGEETKKYKYYKNVGVAILEVERATPDSAAEAVVESLQASSAVSSVEAESLVYANKLNSTLPSRPVSPPYANGISNLRQVNNSKGVEANSTDNLYPLNEPDVIGPNDGLTYMQWGLVDIEAYAAWRAANLTADFYHPTVMVIDTGIDYRHEDLGMSAYVNREEMYGDVGVDDDDNGYTDDILGLNAITGDGIPLDDEGHGTHCAGIIGAMTNNGRGIAGTHYGASLVPCKFLDSEGYGKTGDAIMCIDYAISINVDVLNNSYGSEENSPALYQSFMRASLQGIVAIASAGNDGHRLRDDAGDVYLKYPCAYDVPGLICVAALTAYDELPTWSNWGLGFVQIAAPGAEIVSTYLDQTYSSLSGTSMAAPFVAGAAAFLKTVNMSLTHLQIVDIILRTARPFTDWEAKVDYGKLNVAAAVALAMSPEFDMGTTTTTATTTNWNTPPPPSRVILGAAHHTCEEECVRYGWECERVKTFYLNKDLNHCIERLKADPPQMLPQDFSLGGDVNVNTLPHGCFVNASFEVGMNRMTYGVRQNECRAATAFGEQVWRVCSCKY